MPFPFPNSKQIIFPFRRLFFRAASGWRFSIDTMFISLFGTLNKSGLISSPLSKDLYRVPDFLFWFSGIFMQFSEEWVAYKLLSLWLLMSWWFLRSGGNAISSIPGNLSKIDFNQACNITKSFSWLDFLPNDLDLEIQVVSDKSLTSVSSASQIWNYV